MISQEELRRLMAPGLAKAQVFPIKPSHLTRRQKRMVTKLSPKRSPIVDGMIRPLWVLTDADELRWRENLAERKKLRERRSQRRQQHDQSTAKRQRRNKARRSPAKYLTPMYVAYITSDAWKSKRQEVFEVHGRQCVKCGAIKNLQCHHLTYERLGNENVRTDLQVLCVACHENHHGRKFGLRTKSR